MRKTALVWWLACLVIFALVGCGGGTASHARSYAVTPRPTLAADQAPPRCRGGMDHSLGDCLPVPKQPIFELQAGLSIAPPQGTIRCVDLSNNDPVFGVGAWRTIKAHGFQCAYFKVNESTGFIDSTAAQMTHDARAAGLLVGGYDFQHICGPRGADEGQVFADHLISDGLTGPDTMPPARDAEFGGGCDARAWENDWAGRVVRVIHPRSLTTYTGEWFWGPTLGCWWDGDWAWISGYTGSIGNVPRICSHANIDLWQYSDVGWNGVRTSDVSVWENSNSQFASFANTGPTVAQFNSWRRARDASLRGYHKQHCSQPVLTREACRTLASRVNSFQVLVDQQGQGPSCFGSRRKVLAPVCQVVRPAVAVWTRADVSSIRFGNVGVARYFEGRITKTLATSRF